MVTSLGMEKPIIQAKSDKITEDAVAPFSFSFFFLSYLNFQIPINDWR